MASDVDVVRVTESQLRKIADKRHEHKSKVSPKEDTMQKTDDKSVKDARKKREAKRPAIVFYQPGVTRLSNRKSESNVASQHDDREKNETTQAKTEALVDEARDSREDITSPESSSKKNTHDVSGTNSQSRKKGRGDPSKISQDKDGNGGGFQSPVSPTVDRTERKDSKKSKKPDRVLYTAPHRAGKQQNDNSDESGDRQEQDHSKKGATAKVNRSHQDFPKKTKQDQDKAQPRKSDSSIPSGDVESRKVAMDPVGEITVTLSSALDISDPGKPNDWSGKKSAKRYSRNKHERYRTESTGSDMSLNSNEDIFIPHHEDWEAEMMDVGPPLMGTWENQTRERAGPKRGKKGAKSHPKEDANDFEYDGQTYIIQRTENWEEETGNELEQCRETKQYSSERNQGSHRKGKEEVVEKSQAHSPRSKGSRSASMKHGTQSERARDERREDRPARDRPNRKDQTDGKPSFEREVSQDDHRKGRLNVTFNDHVREVKVPADNERNRTGRPIKARDRREPKSHARESQQRSSNDYEESFKGTSPTAKGGGIIHLPQSVQLGSSPTGDSHRHIPVSHHEPNRGHRGRGRAPDHSRLWDPSKPQQKPAVNRPSPPQLHFHDPEFDRNYSRESEFQHSPGPYQRSEYYPDFPPLSREQPYQEPGYPDRHYRSAPTYPDRGQPSYPYYDSGYGNPTGEGDRDRSWGEQADRSMPYYPPPAGSPSFHDHGKAHYGEHHRDDDVVLQTVKARNQDSALRLLNQAKPLEIQLSNILSRRFHGTESIDAVFRLRMELEQVYEGIILLDVQIADQKRVELQLWKNAYHQVIESFRKQLQDEEGENLGMKERLLKLLDQGTTFYESLLNKLQETYHFKLAELTGGHPLQNVTSRSIPRKLGIIHAQKCMIYLGDLARYKEQANETSNYGKARSWYLKAQQIAPKNGKPYNQLAILAVYTRRKLDAVYYYMRSLASSNPFGSARESLMTLFEEARRKAEHTEKKRKEESSQRNAPAQRHNKNMQDDMPLRLEVWYTHDGQVESEESNTGGDPRDESDLSKLSPVELNKRFVLSFLHIHGKLFTKIGMERFPEVALSMLQEFQALLEHSPSPLGNTRLLQLMAINMFAVHNTALRDPVSESVRSFIQEQAIQLGLDMFGLIVSRCVQLLKENDNNVDNKTGLLGEDLHEYLPCIKVWTDWMVCHPQLWNPPPDCCAPEHSVSVDVWYSLAELFNSLKVVDTSKVTMISEPKEGYDLVLLPEDTMLSGFVPLLTLPLDLCHVDKQIDKVLAEDCVRISQLLMFGEYLCGQESPLLAYSVEKRCYISIAPTRAQSEKVDSEKDHSSSLSQEEDDVIIESSADEEDFEDDTDTHDIKRLKAQKDALKKRVKEEKRRQEHIQAVVESHSKARPFRLEVRPVYIVPDTNCFIDHLKGVQMIVDSKRYTLIVPLVVINELDGLAKGSREGQYINAAHANRVQQGARAAISYLEDEFELYNNRIRAVTSRGSVLDTIAFRSEDPQGKTGNNDDVILSCCMFYCEDKAQSFMPQRKDDPIMLQREVVLLTDDRNLRVKAYTRTVPTRSIPDFIKKARVVKR
ncbi:telomerase-binding protein EST1A-like [Ptychodera flava]|uniref:telomerase-binding protein EST1A-like n=1 Tax=Ptychodera flava TaxID=63121 RepID=UPI003969C0E2